MSVCLGGAVCLGWGDCPWGVCLGGVCLGDVCSEGSLPRGCLGVCLWRCLPDTPLPSLDTHLDTSMWTE